MEVNMAIFVQPITYIIGFLGLIIVLAMLKSFITHGVAIAITEFLLNSGDEQRLRIVRWFVNSDEVMKCIKEIDEKTGAVK